MDHEIGTYGMATDYCIMKEGMSILKGRKSVPRISSSERENRKKGTTLSLRELHDKELTGAPQGEELGLMKPLSESSCSCSDNSFISDGAKRYGARATGVALGIRSIWDSTGRAGGRPGESLGNTSGKSWTIEHEITVNRDSLLIISIPLCITHNIHPSLSIPISPILVIQLRTISLEMSWISTLKTTISLRVWPIAASTISSIGVASAPAIAGIVSYFAAFVTLQSARARVIALALGALGRISLIGLFLSRSQVVCFRDILLLERLLVVSEDVIRLSFAIRFSFRIGSPLMYLSTFSVSLDMNLVQIRASSWKRLV
nr:hypothetical protein [Tanacetum cinerariifolium]